MSKVKKKNAEKKIQKMTGAAVRAVLSICGELLVDWIDIMEVATSRQFSLSSGGIERMREMRQQEYRRFMQEWAYEMRRRKWIIEKKKGERILIALTERGKEVFFRECMQRAPLCVSGECIIVIFDIPEHARMVRNQLRQFLRSCDFSQLQKSVWMTRRDALGALQKFVRETKSEEWIRAFRAQEV